MMIWRLLATALAQAREMDSIDKGVFVIAIVAIPFVAWANIHWWLKVRRSELPRDWQSFWMIMFSLICMIAIVCWYLFMSILPSRA